MKVIEIQDINNSLKTHHRKRERAVYFDDEFYYKFWVPDWEHGLVTRYGLESGFYDEKISCVFDCLIIYSKKDVGYRMQRATVAGGSRDSWEKLISSTTEKTRQQFMLAILEKSLRHQATVTDMCPSNVVIQEGKISLIDYEGLASFQWLFDGKPRAWEAQNRNLARYPSPFWRDMSKHIKSYTEQCIGMTYNEDISSEKKFIEFYNRLKAYLNYNQV